MEAAKPPAPRAALTAPDSPQAVTAPDSPPKDAPGSGSRVKLTATRPAGARPAPPPLPPAAESAAAAAAAQPKTSAAPIYEMLVRTNGMICVAVPAPSLSLFLRDPEPNPARLLQMHKFHKPTQVDLVTGHKKLRSQDEVFSSGRHFAQCTLVKGAEQVLLGVSHPGWDSELKANSEGEIAVDASDQEGHCYYYTGNGRRFPGGHDWDGRAGAKEGDRIGLLIDMEEGSLTVFKNDELLGVMQSSSLTGQMNWSVERSNPESVVRVVRREQVPAAPSVYEQVAAAARHKQLKPVATIERSHLHTSLSQKSLELSFDGELEKCAPEPEPEPEEGVPPV